MMGQPPEVGCCMPTHLVNLDALLEREDFESSDTSIAALGQDPTFKIGELKSDQLYFSVLRKPHFQRETNNWSPERISEFVKSFLDNELIPAIIIWHSKVTGKIFVIDGAHRVSSLIAWVNDDYGDGTISRKANNFEIEPAQRKLHNTTKELIEKEIGSFQHLLDVGLGKVSAKDDVMARRARTIATRRTDLQRVEGDAEIAQTSFLKINGNAIPIDDTELDFIHARKKPNTLAARAFMRAGRGHKYWGKLPNAEEIERCAREVYELVFGRIVEIGATSPDIPRAGQPYSNEALKMTLDIVNYFNDVTPTMWQRPSTKPHRSPESELVDDVDGTATLEYLENVKKICQSATGNTYPGSFGFDHAVYCYGATGKFHPAALLASFALARDIYHDNIQIEFTEVRANFEEYLIRHKHFFNKLGHSRGSRTRSLSSVLKMHRSIIESLRNGIKDDDGITTELAKVSGLEILGEPVNTFSESVETPPRGRGRFSKTATQVALIREIVENRPKCPLCNARLPSSARSRDHKQRTAEGGTSHDENLQFTHPYCNSGYKEWLASKARRVGTAVE